MLGMNSIGDEAGRFLTAKKRGETSGLEGPGVLSPLSSDFKISTEV
jgi:hypothetical protein